MIRTPRKKFSNRRYLSQGDCCSRGFPPVAAGVRGRAGLESQVGGRARSSGSPGPAASAAPGSPGGVARQPGSSRRHNPAVPDGGSRRRAVRTMCGRGPLCRSGPSARPAKQVLLSALYRVLPSVSVVGRPRAVAGPVSVQLGMLMAVRPCRPISWGVAMRRRCLRYLPICLTLLGTRLLVMGLLRFLRFRRLRQSQSATEVLLRGCVLRWPVYALRLTACAWRRLPRPVPAHWLSTA